MRALMLHLVFALSIVFAAEDITVTASVDKTTAFLGDVVTLTVTVQGRKLPSVSAPRFPATNDWSLRGTSSSTSTSIQIINGKMTSSKTIDYIYFIIPQRTGKLVIPSMEVLVGGKKYRTKPITVNILSGGAKPRQPKKGGPSARQPARQPQSAEQDIFIGVDANKKSAYQGEQITVYFTLYSRLDLVNLSYKKDAEFKNAWVETIFEATRLQPRVVTIGGKRYYAFPIKTVAAFPLMPGYVTVEPMELKCVVQYPPRSFFDFGRRAEIIARSKPLKIKVLSLPEAGKPDGFTGAVGKFSFSLKADRDTLSVGDALGITVRVSGAGNIETITLPQPQFPQDFEVFDKKEKVTKDVKGEQIIGTKTAEYVVVPHSEGEFIIPPVEFSYFNPRTRKYVKLLSDSIRIVVGPGKGVSVVGPVGRSRIVAVGGDIEFIKPDAIRLTVGKLSLPNGLRALWFIPIEILAILGAYAYRLRYERMLKDIKRIKASRAFKEAQRKLSGVRRAKDAAQALSAIYDAIFQFIAAKLGIEAGAVIFDEAAAKLMEKGVPEETIEGLRDALDKIHSSRFAPAGEHCDVVELSEKVREYLKTIDETFGRT